LLKESLLFLLVFFDKALETLSEQLISLAECFRFAAPGYSFADVVNLYWLKPVTFWNRFPLYFSKLTLLFK